MKKYIQLLSASAVSTIALTISTPVLAIQETKIEKPANTLEEIVVTSRRREESLQNIPESITAFSATQIERSSIKSFRDVANLTPNLSQLENFRPGLARIQIRGIITPQVGDAPLAFVVDGVPASDLEFINQDLVDIERIEVLRGAQGALYGRGAIGGAVNIVTKKPTDEFEGNFSIGYGNGDSKRVSGLVSGPILEDKVYFRVGGYYNDTDGLIDNTFLGTNVDFKEEYSVFGSLSLVLSDRTNVDIRTRYVSTDSGLGYYQAVSPSTFEDFDIETSQNILGIDNREIFEANIRLQHDFDFASLEVVAGYSQSEQSAFSDADFVAVESDFVGQFAAAQENILDVSS